jgi:hypothetical protein
MSNEIRTAALSYEHLGLSVIPVEPRGKRPLVEWQEYQSRRATQAEIKGWWAKWPKANVGVVTGEISGLVVVDVDSADAAHLLHEQVPELDFRSIPRSRTGKGWQLFFNHPGVKVENRTAIFSGLDFRGDGGYVVAPPSVHPNGKTYVWKFLHTPFSPLPEKLFELIKAPAVDPSHPTVDTSAIWEGISEGERDTQIFKYACRCRALGYPENEAMILVMEAATRCTPPFPETEARLKLKQAYRYPEGHAKVSQPPLQNGQSDFWPDLSPAKVLLEQEDKTSWLWLNAIPEGAISMIAGQPRSGKSTLALNLCLAMARGNEFLNRLTNRSRVAYISIDNSPTEMKLIASGMGLVETDNIFFHLGQVPQMAVQWLFDVIQKNSIRFAVVDTFQRFLHIEEINDSAIVTKAMDPINHEAQKIGCALMWIHHSGKGGMLNTRALGSIAIKALSPYYFELSREEGARILTSDLRNGKNFEDAYLKIDQQTGWTVVAGNKFDAMIERACGKILEFLSIEQVGVTEKTIKDEVDMRPQFVSRAIRMLLKHDQLERTGRGVRTDPFKYTRAGDLTARQPNGNPNPETITYNSSILYIGSRTQNPINAREGGIGQSNLQLNQTVIQVPTMREPESMGKEGQVMGNSTVYSGSQKSGNQLGTSSEPESKKRGVGNQNPKGQKEGSKWGRIDRVLCRNCYIQMDEDEQGFLCPKCGLRHNVPKGIHIVNGGSKDEF